MNVLQDAVLDFNPNTVSVQIQHPYESTPNAKAIQHRILSPALELHVLVNGPIGVPTPLHALSHAVEVLSHDIERVLIQLPQMEEMYVQEKIQTAQNVTHKAVSFNLSN